MCVETTSLGKHPCTSTSPTIGDDLQDCLALIPTDH